MTSKTKKNIIMHRLRWRLKNGFIPTQSCNRDVREYLYGMFVEKQLCGPISVMSSGLNPTRIVRRLMHENPEAS